MSDDVQRAYFEEAEVERFRWTTSAPGFAETEDELLAGVGSKLSSPLLEVLALVAAIGCSLLQGYYFARPGRGCPEPKMSDSDEAAA